MEVSYGGHGVVGFEGAEGERGREEAPLALRAACPYTVGYIGGTTNIIDCRSRMEVSAVTLMCMIDLL